MNKPSRAVPSQFSTLNSQFPKGYKQTEIGVIPEDWEVALVKDISDVKSGKRLPLGNFLSDIATPFPYIRVADMSTGTINIKDIKYVPEDVYPSIKNYRIFTDDIFISVAGTLGIIGKIPDQLNGANLTENADRLTEITCSRDYLMYMLMSSLIQNTIDSERTLGAQPKLALTRIRKFKIPLPPTKAEQEAIAGALSDADEWIAALTRLIAKKRQIKQATMQTLLNPFENGQLKPGWVEKKLGDVAPLQRGFDLPNPQLVPGKYPVVYSNGIVNFHHKKQVLGPGVVTGRSGTLGAVHFIERDFWPHNTTLWVTDFYENNPKFIYYLFCKIGFTRFGSGSGVPTLNRNDAHSFVVGLPKDKAEQTAIASILSDMDAQIAALEGRLNKAHHIKQGMMSELLTGKTRLIEN